ncbi:MAG: hypothetical protein GY822_00845 [Deltaproteobacteria bacterium]|nr:hypothetical protein [Deltaproteobacteria bacterium]
MKAYLKSDGFVHISLFCPLLFVFSYFYFIRTPILDDIMFDIAYVSAFGIGCTMAMLPVVRWRFRSAARKIGIPGTVAIRFARMLAKQESHTTIRGLVMAFPILFKD